MAQYDADTALIVVDVQNDFADPKGGLYVRGGDEIVPRINDEIARAREAGAYVVFTQDWHPESTPHFQKDGGIWPVHCVRETWGAAFHPALHADGEVIRKGTNGEDGYSAFSMRDPKSGEETATPLYTLLRVRAIQRVVVVGIAADVCVKATALDALAKGFETVVPRELTRGVDLQAGDTERAFAELAAAGASVE